MRRRYDVASRLDNDRQSSKTATSAFLTRLTINHSSSSLHLRFGKYTQLQFSSGVLVGSECGVYLLEESRVCGVGGGERGYHVFYQVLDAGEEVKVRRN